MSTTISVKDLATELDVPVSAVSFQVSALCKAGNPAEVVHIATASNARCVLTATAADAIREHFTTATA